MPWLSGAMEGIELMGSHLRENDIVIQYSGFRIAQSPQKLGQAVHPHLG